MFSYYPKGICARQFLLDFDGNKIKSLKVIGGCSGNSQGISKLVQDMEIDDVIAKLKGIQCRNGTSCPDQLTKALEDYKQKNNL